MYYFSLLFQLEYFINFVTVDYLWKLDFGEELNFICDWGRIDSNIDFDSLFIINI